MLSQASNPHPIQDCAQQSVRRLRLAVQMAFAHFWWHVLSACVDRLASINGYHPMPVLLSRVLAYLSLI